MPTPHLDRARGIVADAEAAADAMLVPMPAVQVIACPECQGSTRARLLGPLGEPQVCPTCRGAGRCPKTEAGRKKLREAELNRELLRLRDLYRAVREARDEAVKGAEAREYPADLEASKYRRRLAELEARGISTRAELDVLKGRKS
jgi:hypothetical protein